MYWHILSTNQLNAKTLVRVGDASESFSYIIYMIQGYLQGQRSM